MIKNFQKKLPIFQFHLLQKFSGDFEHAVLTRAGGASAGAFESLNVRFNVGDDAANVKRNRATICKALGVAEKWLVSADQTHSKNVCVVDEVMMEGRGAGEEIADVDAFVTNLRDVALMMQVADCQALLFFDPVKKVVAAVHAGWRGLMKDVSGATIAVMKKKFGVKPENLLVGIGPSLGPCCAFFSEPARELSADFKPYINFNNTVDLWSFSSAQLVKHGVRPEHIENARVCTMCDAGKKFFSFRRDHGVTGRNGALIFLR